MNEIERESTKDPDTAAIRSPLPTFLLLTLAFTAVFYALIIIPGKLLGGGGRYTTGMMWCPGFAALLACRIHGIPIQALGWRWAGFRFQAASYLLPAAYSLAAYVVIWGTTLGGFPNPTFIRESVSEIGISGVPPLAAAVIMVLLQAVYGFIRSCANALGEEIGWRGFLTPLLFQKWGFGVASLATGCIWAVWHYPILLLADYNLGAPGWYALLCFTLMVTGLSVIYTWFRLRTGSLWTATFLHASHNILIQAVFTPLTVDTGPTKYAVDEFGFVLPLVIATIAIWFWRKRSTALAAWQESGSESFLPPNNRLQRLAPRAAAEPERSADQRTTSASQSKLR